MGGGKARSAKERAGAVHDKTIINQIMLRFRPIAPKPAGDGDSAGSGDPNPKGLVSKKRAKRKYVRINKSKVCVKNKADDEDESVVTLQLLPVTKEESPSADLSHDLNIPVVKHVEGGFKSSDRTAVMAERRVVETWVTIECVTDGCENQGWLGGTDTEKVRNLEVDTCPGFLFDGVDVVQWVNLSYRRMVVGDGEWGEAPPEVVVWVAVKGRFPAERGAFTCSVRVVYYRNASERHSLTVPCDVWKMEYGGFACRLDVEAALSLGR